MTLLLAPAVRRAAQTLHTHHVICLTVEAQEGQRVVVHYEAKWKGITFVVRPLHPPPPARAMQRHHIHPTQTSRQGAGVTGGTPLGFDVGAKRGGKTLPGLDLVCAAT